MRKSKKVLSLFLSLVMILSMFTELEVLSIAQDPKEQEIIKSEIDETKFEKKEVPFDKNNIIGTCFDGNYTLFMTAVRKDGKSLECSYEETEDYYETTLNDVVYTLYFTDDYENFKSVTLNMNYEDMDFYFDNFNIINIEQENIYYISAFYSDYFENEFHYGAFFDGENLTVLDKNIAREELLLIAGKYVLVDNDFFSQIVDYDYLSTDDYGYNKYRLYVSPFYYVSEDLKEWIYTQGPIHTLEQEYYYSEPVIGEIDYSSRFSLVNGSIDILCFRCYPYVPALHTYYSSYSDVYYSEDANNFILLEGVNDFYNVCYVIKSDEKVYAMVQLYKMIGMMDYEREKTYLLEYENGEIINKLIDYRELWSHWFYINYENKFSTGFVQIDNNEIFVQNDIFDISSDGTIETYFSRINGKYIGFNSLSYFETSKVFCLLYGEDTLLVFDDFKKIYMVELPSEFNSTIVDGDKLVLMGEDIYMISENDVLNLIGNGVIEEPTTKPTTEPTTKEPETEVPTTDPTTKEPETEPTTKEPVTQAPTTEKPSERPTERPSTDGPAIDGPATDGPTEKPTEAPPQKPVSDKLEVKDDTIKVDNASKISTVKTKSSADDIIKSVKNKNVSIIDKNGKAISGDTLVGTGAKIQIKDNSGKVINTYTVCVPNDVDGNGKTTAADARLALRGSARLEKIEGVYARASDVTGDGKITAADARKILRISAGLEKY